MDPEMNTEQANGDNQEGQVEGDKSGDISQATSGRPGDVEQEEPADSGPISSTGAPIQGGCWILYSLNTVPIMTACEGKASNQETLSCV